MRYLLDTAALISKPELLAVAGPGIELLVTRQSQNLLRGAAQLNWGLKPISELLSDAVARSIVRVVDVPEEPITAAARPSRTDWYVRGDVLDAARTEDATIVTTDGALIDAAWRARLSVIAPNELLDERRRNLLPDVTDQAAAATRKHLLSTVANAGITLAFAGGLVVVFRYADVLIEELPTWGSIVSVAVAGIVLYFLRQRARAVYGGVELFAALATAWYTVFRSRDVAHLDMPSAMQILAAVYIFVRGMDNVDVGLGGTNIGARWRRFFGGKDAA